jgi:hypothetical protein
MSQPWDKWYAQRWLSEPTLRKCGRSAKSLWFDCLCLMMLDGGDRLEIKGKPCTEADLAREFGDDPRTIRRLIAELEGHGVFDRDPDGTIVSRMRRRQLRQSEEMRARGLRGGNPALRGASAQGFPTDSSQNLESVGPLSSKINGFHGNGLKPRIQSPDIEDEEERARTGAHARDPLFRRILIAAGYDPDGAALPPRWQPPGAEAHVLGWRTLGLRDDQIELTVVENRKRHAGELPSTPAAFDRAMQRQAAELAAPPLQPAPQHGGTTDANRRRGRRSRADDNLDAFLRGAARE